MYPIRSGYLQSLGCALVVGWAITSAAQAEEGPSFEKDVRPILKEYCLDCHGGSEKVGGKLDLRLARFAVKGGRTGPAIEPGKPKESLLIERIIEGEMPPGEKKLSAEKVAVIEKWIANGAKTLRDEPESLPDGIDITPEERAYWFFQPLQTHEVPEFTAEQRVRTPIDAIILARLKEHDLGFNPEADKLTLIRRASLDLTGLPPTPEEVVNFLNDESPNAYEKLIDRLLASPAYGERWGRHWLDVIGYADSEGDGSTDTPRGYAWKYRDYVIRSLNADKPINQFIVEQLAGDELAGPKTGDWTPEQIELLTATGFLRTGPDNTIKGNGPEEKEQAITDTIQIVSAGLLGLSVACAQCHDHRYDPIPQVDYYRLRAVFEPGMNPAQWRKPNQRLISLYTEEDRKKAAEVNAEVAKMNEEFNKKQAKFIDAAFEEVLKTFPEEERAELREAFKTPEGQRTPEQKQLVAKNPKLNITPGVLYQYNVKASDELKADREKINAKAAEKPVEDFVSVFNEPGGKQPETKLFYRGDYRDPRQVIPPGDLTIAAPDGQRLDIPDNDPNIPTSGRRLAWAKHLTNGEHPLFGRVLMNRLWLYHFGRGIVDTPGEFGILGDRPSHPELLDWLATELPRQGWSLKQMHKLVMTSTVYRQSSERRAEHDSVDSANRLFGRYPVRRLEAEVLRDRMLATAGRLDSRHFGSPVPVTKDPTGQAITPNDQPRRSVYLQVRRSEPIAFLSAFDSPTGELNCNRRYESTSASQSLMLMNSEFVTGLARDLAVRVIAETKPTEPATAMAGTAAVSLRPTDCQSPAERAWQLAFQRPATDEERLLAERFLNTQIDRFRKTGVRFPELTALTNLCQQLLSANEFLYVD